jgi:pilus assembly protein CpaB
MRSSTLISLLVAIILAVLAVFGTRTWLATQRQQLAAESQAGQDNKPRHLVVVANAGLGFGERLTADKLTTLDWASDTLPEGAFTDIAGLVGTTDEEARYVLSSIAKGEMILPSKITSPGQRAKLSTALSPGMKAVSIRVNDVLGVAGFVLPGDRVDVMLTRDGSDDQPFVDVLLQGVRVLAIDQISDDRKDQPSVVRTVTFEVSTEEAQTLTLGANIGTLSLALRNLVSTGIEDAERVTLDDLDRIGNARRAEEEAKAAAAQAAEAARVAALEADLAAARQAAEEASAQKSAEEVAQREAEAKRIAELEAELKKTQELAASAAANEGDNARIAELEALIRELQSMSSQPEVEIPAEPVAELPVISSFVSVGVVRGGQRAEYQVLFDDK